ncbi:hypothetical protein ACHHYP_12808 [Achlya hypogyna]|uniref:BZIP domain-containing protein n=1 Tax=Achlya hypogyna TaxID=1202772 RepID=A0A1V9YGG5_ACHHY|nr:hypothetical protein ACHHYP_12808 [Achlya hypogyna]
MGPWASEDDDRRTDDREARLRKDRLRKTKYRQEKLAELHELKTTASALELQLGQLRAARQRHPRLPSLTRPRPRLSWKVLASREQALTTAAWHTQIALRAELEETLATALRLAQQRPPPPRQMVLPSRPASGLPRHPLRRVDAIQRLLTWQVEHMTENFFAHVLPALEAPPAAWELVLDGSNLAFVETRRQGVVYGASIDVAAVLWRLWTTHSTATVLDADTVVLTAAAGPEVLWKRVFLPTLLGAPRVALVSQSVVGADTSFDASWCVIDELPRLADGAEVVSVLRSVEQAALTDLPAYAEHLVRHVAASAALDAELRRHFACLSLT